ncbi:MAG: iron-containing alcohol dehydrogenase [Christensenellaceae bacterium]|jgi:alcohol dehydrogenase YqhD (iron-dependent ADH family)|nr:iron-containing alcohol dehydrogenase [Christensenellaceae bacterium]
MNSFIFQNPTKIYFGENAIRYLGDALKPYGKNILLTYGMGSIKKSGIYDATMDILKKSGKCVYELSGIMPNPRKEKVYEGIHLCRKHKIDIILAVGGGSVIDCSKFIAAGTKTDRDFWHAFLVNQEECYDALPLASILTLAGTGSEMNCGGVISDFENKLKLAYSNPLLYPKFSILDPTYTYTLSHDQTTYGTIDAISHILEVYFSKPDDSNLSDDLAEAILKNIISSYFQLLSSSHDYTAKANLMWCTSLALNGLLSLGKEGDWMSHQIEHALSAFYDIPHGAGLAIVHPNYLEFVYKSAIPKFARFARVVMGVKYKGKTDAEVALDGIYALKDFFRAIGAPTKLQDVNISESAIEMLANTVIVYPTSYAKKFSKDDVKTILHACLEHKSRKYEGGLVP